MFSEYFQIIEKETIAPSNIHEFFQLHTHEEYEVLLFLEGDSTYIIEDKSYPLEPYDIIIVRKNELHRIYHNSPAFYHRINLFVHPEFFQQNNCEKYESFFTNSSYTSNKIPGDIVRSTGIYDAFMKYILYKDSYNLTKAAPVLKAIVIEILFLINKTTAFSKPAYTNPSLNPLISYLNDSYTEDITLDFLETKFSFSKHYLCRAFRKATGLTIHDYIRKKRLAHVRELIATGMSITDAAMSSGFRDYSSFYRAYQKEFGTSPKKDLK